MTGFGAGLAVGILSTLAVEFLMLVAWALLKVGGGDD